MFISNKKGSRRFYDVLINASETVVQYKWEQESGELSKYEVVHYNSVITELEEVTLKNFQFKINNKLLDIKYSRTSMVRTPLGP